MEINYLTSKEELYDIFETINIDPILVTNVYNYGSRVHKSASVLSDYDILVVANIKQPPLQFIKKNKPYFHKFDVTTLQINDKTYDIVLYSNENFELLINCHFMLVVESLFNPKEFIPINKIDYKKIYLDKYYSINKIKSAIYYEYGYSLNCIGRYKNGKLRADFNDRW